MKKYKFITIECDSQDVLVQKTYTIHNKKWGDALGIIAFHFTWRKWVLKSNQHTIWSADCLHDVIDFIENETPKATK